MHVEFLYRLDANFIQMNDVLIQIPKHNYLKHSHYCSFNIQQTPIELYLWIINRFSEIKTDSESC